MHTPLIPVPLQGPAIFVSHGGEAFPSLTLVLQGYGITIDLVGTTDIKNGVTSTTFKTVPDQPFSSFELTLPEGPYSALTAPGNLCTAKNLTMPTEFLAQNGAELKQSTKIAVTGCPKQTRRPRTRRRSARPRPSWERKARETVGNFKPVRGSSGRGWNSTTPRRRRCSRGTGRGRRARGEPKAKASLRVSVSDGAQQLLDVVTRLVVDRQVWRWCEEHVSLDDPCVERLGGASQSRSRPAAHLESTRSCASKHQATAVRSDATRGGISCMMRRSCQPRGAFAVSGPPPWAS